MTETLSDDARLVLAFIRDHPGLREIDMTKQLGFDEPRLATSLMQLHKANLIISHFAAGINPKSLQYAPGQIRYYPA